MSNINTEDQVALVAAAAVYDQAIERVMEQEQIKMQDAAYALGFEQGKQVMCSQLNSRLCEIEDIAKTHWSARDEPATFIAIKRLAREAISIISQKQPKENGR